MNGLLLREPTSRLSTVRPLTMHRHFLTGIYAKALKKYGPEVRRFVFTLPEPAPLASAASADAAPAGVNATQADAAQKWQPKNKNKGKKSQ